MTKRRPFSGRGRHRYRDDPTFLRVFLSAAHISKRADGLTDEALDAVMDVYGPAIDAERALRRLLDGTLRPPGTPAVWW